MSVFKMNREKENHSLESLLMLFQRNFVQKPSPMVTTVYDSYLSSIFSLSLINFSMPV